jgi:hypothetical protein
MDGGALFFSLSQFSKYFSIPQRASESQDETPNTQLTERYNCKRAVGEKLQPRFSPTAQSRGPCSAAATAGSSAVVAELSPTGLAPADYGTPDLP